VQSIYRTLQQHLQAASAHCPSPLPSPLSAIGQGAALFVAAAVNSADMFDYITQRAALSHTQGFVCLAGLHPLLNLNPLRSLNCNPALDNRTFICSTH
jgi:hypothetical protein